MAGKLQGTVGKDGDNAARDVRVVQTLLNEHARSGGYAKVRISGKVDDATIRAILRFQKAVVGIQPDGLVEPGKKTIRALQREPQGGGGGAAGQATSYTIKLDGDVYTFATREESEAFARTLKKIRIQGKEVILTPAQYTAYVKEYVSELKCTVVLPIRLRAVGAESIWNHFARISREELFASWCVQLWGPKLPPHGVVSKASGAMARIDGALKSGDPKAIVEAISSNEPIVNSAYETMFEYRKAVTGRTDGWIKALKFTKTASFTIVAAIAAPQLVAAGATAGQAAFLVGVGASAMPSIGNEVGKGLAGTSTGALDAVYNVGIDSAIGGTVGVLLKGKTGQEVLKSVEERILKNVARSGWFSKISSQTLRRWLAGYLKTAGKAGLEESVKTVGARVGKSAKGEKYTKKEFLDDVAGIVQNTLLAGFLNGFDQAVDKSFAPGLYRSIMRSKLKVTLVGLTGKRDKVLIGAMFEGLSKDQAVKTIQDVIKGSGSDTAGLILGWGLERFGGSDPKKLVERTASEALASPAWKAMQEKLVKKVKGKSKVRS